MINSKLELFGALNKSKNSENIHGGSPYIYEASHDFSLNFWNDELGSKNRSELNQLWILNFILLFGNVWKLRKCCKMKNWNFIHNLEVHLVVAKRAIAIGLEV